MQTNDCKLIGIIRESEDTISIQQKSCQENTDGPANNLRREGVCFHREPANIVKIRENFC